MIGPPYPIFLITIATDPGDHDAPIWLITMG
jgi:hypothetical protein